MSKQKISPAVEVSGVPPITAIKLSAMVVVNSTTSTVVLTLTLAAVVDASDVTGAEVDVAW